MRMIPGSAKAVTETLLVSGVAAITIVRRPSESPEQPMAGLSTTANLFLSMKPCQVPTASFGCAEDQTRRAAACSDLRLVLETASLTRRLDCRGWPLGLFWPRSGQPVSTDRDAIRSLVGSRCASGSAWRV